MTQNSDIFFSTQLSSLFMLLRPCNALYRFILCLKKTFSFNKPFGFLEGVLGKEGARREKSPAWLHLGEKNLFSEQEKL